MVRGTVVNLGFYAHAAAAVGGELLSPRSWLAAAFFGLFGSVIALMKDVPDVSGGGACFRWAWVWVWIWIWMCVCMRLCGCGCVCMCVCSDPVMLFSGPLVRTVIALLKDVPVVKWGGGIIYYIY